MPTASRTLLALALLARPLAAQVGPFATELSVGFGYGGSSTQRPLVVLDGVPTAAYAYSADAREHAVEVAATRWLRPLGDDGTTPLALLPYVARASSVAARFALAGASRDSFGSFSGRASTYESRVAGDGTARDADLAAEWFLGRSFSLRAGLAYASERETAASTSVEEPSGRTDVSTAGTRVSGPSGSLGVAFRLGEHEVSVTGGYGASDAVREDASAFTGGTQPYSSRLETESLARRGTVAARLLFLGRRLTVDLAGEYVLATSSSDLEGLLSGPYAKGRSITRRGAVEATWFATRRLGLTAAFEYATRDASSGPAELLRPSSSATTRTLGVAARWFATERVSVVLSAARAEGDSVAPPGATTYQRFDEATNRVALGAAARF